MIRKESRFFAIAWSCGLLRTMYVAHPWHSHAMRRWLPPVLFGVAITTMTLVSVAFASPEAVPWIIGATVLGMTLGVVNAAVSAERVERYLSALAFGCAVLAYLVAAWIAPATGGSMAFYEVAAQVIPVLVLALAVEARAFSLRGEFQAITGVVTLYVLAWGEYEALRAVFYHAPASPKVVVGAISAGFVAAAVIGLAGRSEASDR